MIRFDEHGIPELVPVTKPVGGTALRSFAAQIPSYWFGVDTPPCVEVKR